METAKVLKRFDLAPGASRVIEIRYWPERTSKRVFFQLRADCSNCRIPADLRIAFSSETSLMGGLGLDEILILGAGGIILLIGLLVFMLLLRGRRKNSATLIEMNEPVGPGPITDMISPLNPQNEPELRIGPSLDQDRSPRVGGRSTGRSAGAVPAAFRAPEPAPAPAPAPQPTPPQPKAGPKAEPDPPEPYS